MTDEGQADQALREALARATWLGQFPAENPSPVLRVSAEGTVLYRNPATDLTPGWACETGRPLPDPLRPLVEGALQRQRTARRDLRIGGRWYSVAVAPFPHEGYANIYVTDVTERVAAEKALRDAKEQLEERVEHRTEALNTANRALEIEIAERRRGEQREQAERQRLYDVLETLPAYVVLLAPDYHVPFANRFFRERFGESHGRCCFEYLFGRTSPCENCETFKVFETKAAHRWAWTGPDGRSYDVYDFPFRDSDGASLVMEMGIDVTERHQAEAQLRRHQLHLEQLVRERTIEVERRNTQLEAEIAERERAEAALVRAKEAWERTFDSVPDLIAIIDNRRRIRRVNRAMAERLRTTPERCTDVPCFRLVHGATCPPEICPLTHTLRDRREHVTEVHEDHLGGDFIVSTTPLLDEAGAMVGSVHVARDITERKHAQAALQEAHDTLEQRVQERTEALERANETLQMISECNQALVRATTEEQLVDDICRIIQGCGRFRMAWVGYAEDDSRKTVRPVAAAGFEDAYLQQTSMSWANDEHGRGPTGTCIRTGKACVGRDFLTQTELRPWREAARERGFRSSIALPLMSGERAFGALMLYAGEVGVFDDRQVMLLTELADDLAFGILARRAAIERDHAREVAEERAGQLAALATELGRVEQRERQRMASVLHDHLQQLLVGAQYHLATIAGAGNAKDRQQAVRGVTRILDEAIAATSTLTAELSPPALHEKGLVAGLEWLTRQMDQKHGLKVRLRSDPAAEPDSEQVRTFLFGAARELLFNAVKHAQVGSARVEVARTGGREVRLVVEDDGAGFDPERLDTHHRVSGGFGLFSIRERLHCLGGRMIVESQPGHGSRFTLLAPVEIPHEATATRAPSPSLPMPAGTNGAGGQSAAGRIRVLLADDHAVLREGLTRLLSEQPDIEVVGEASDGQTAIELTRRLRPDVVLMDVSMPHTNGVDAAERIVAENAGVRVIGLSMHETAAMADAMRAAGAAGYLTKNGPPKRIIAAIRGRTPSPRRGEAPATKKQKAQRAPSPVASKQRRAEPTRASERAAARQRSGRAKARKR